MNDYYIEDAYAVQAGYSMFSLLLGIYGLVLLIGIAMYVFQGIGLYTLADRRGLRHGWLAWLPVGNIWLIGSIADHYRTVTRGERQNRRIAILILTICTFALSILAAVLIIIFVANIGTSVATGETFHNPQLIGQVIALYYCSLGLGLLSNMVSIAMLVLQYVCLYDVYASCDPGNKTLYLLLSILLGLAPIFLFVCRKKDMGMYPQPVPQYLPYGQPVYQQPVYQQPMYQPPVYQEPVYQQPPAPQPTTEEAE